VTLIGAAPFHRCRLLTSITVDTGNPAYASPAGVLYNSALTALIQYPAARGPTYTVLPGVTAIGENAFAECAALSHVSLPSGLTRIGTGAFASCGALAGLEIPDSVTHIDDSAFNRCAGLTTLHLPEGLTYLGSYAFQLCRGLTHLSLPGSLVVIGRSAFYGCTGLVSIVIPPGVTRLERAAFYYCTSLTSLTLPASLASIGINAFNECQSLRDVYFHGSAPAIDPTAFAISGSATFYHLPDTAGWQPTLAGRPTIAWKPRIEAMEANAREFSFTITGEGNFDTIVEASTDLSQPVWATLERLTLNGGQASFKDPAGKRGSGRFYRLRMP
jgi:BspA type Leucine rich repeat region (6 copies)